MKRAVDERVDHGVGHAEEEDPEDIAVLVKDPEDVAVLVEDPEDVKIQRT